MKKSLKVFAVIFFKFFLVAGITKNAEAAPEYTVTEERVLQSMSTHNPEEIREIMASEEFECEKRLAFSTSMYLQADSGIIPWSEVGLDKNFLMEACQGKIIDTKLAEELTHLHYMGSTGYFVEDVVLYKQNLKKYFADYYAIVIYENSVRR